MNDEMAVRTEGPARLRAFAVLIGCALPIQVMGRATIAVSLIAALICFLSLPEKSRYASRAWSAARSPVGMMLLITFIFWLPNVFLSMDPMRSLEGAVRSFVFIGIATLFWAVLAEHRYARDLSLKALILASSLAVTIAIIAQTAVPELFWFMHFRGWADIPLRTSLKPFSSLAIFIVPILIWAGVRLRGVWVVPAAIGTIGFLALVWLTYNRAAISGLLATTLVAAGLTAWHSHSRLIRIASPLAALMVFTGVLVWLNMTRPHTMPGDDWPFPLWLIDFQRQTIWKFAFELFQQNFWFGMGINTINFAPGADAVIPRTYGLAMIPSHPHNWMLEVAAETGIFGLLSLIGVIALTFTRYVRAFIKQGDYPYFVSACIAVGYWVSGLVGFSFWSSWWQMSFVMMVALCLAHNSKLSPKEPHG